MKRIAIDMDDVLAKTTHVIIDRINQLVDKKYTYQELLYGDKSLKEEFYGHYLANNSFLWEPGFFEHIPVNEDAVEVVQKLSEQYEIFIVSRMRETWLKTGNNKEAVISGFTQTVGVVTAAAAIFIAAVSGMAFGHFAGLQELGIGLAIAILIDATLIRGLLLPSAMILLGRWNWWSPKKFPRT